MTSPGTIELTRTDLEAPPGDDQIAHRFCKDQTRVRSETPTAPATARCGKTKAGWVPSTGTDMMCVICDDFTRTGKCVHCGA